MLNGKRLRRVWTFNITAESKPSAHWSKFTEFGSWREKRRGGAERRGVKEEEARIFVSNEWLARPGRANSENCKSQVVQLAEAVVDLATQRCRPLLLRLETRCTSGPRAQDTVGICRVHCADMVSGELGAQVTRTVTSEQWTECASASKSER